MQKRITKLFTGKTVRFFTLFKQRLFDDLWFLRVKIDTRVGRPPVINLEFPAIIIRKHHAKTPRTKKKEEKKESWGTAHPPTDALRDCINRSAPPHSDHTLIAYYLRGLPRACTPPTNYCRRPREIFHWKNSKENRTLF